jgi:ABC-2 type transport system permease protein
MPPSDFIALREVDALSGLRCITGTLRAQTSDTRPAGFAAPHLVEPTRAKGFRNRDIQRRETVRSAGVVAVRAILELWLRSVRRFMRTRARILSSLLQPLLFLVSLGYGLNTVYRAAGRGSAITFVTPGILAMTIMFSATFSGMELIIERQNGFLKELFVSPVSRLAMVAARLLGGATVATIQAVLVLAVFWIAGFRTLSLGSLLATLPVIVLVALLYTVFGLFIAVLQKDIVNSETIVNTSLSPMFFLSGALFPLTGIPVLLWVLSRCDPLTYGVDLLRLTMTGQGYFPFWMDWLILWAALCVFVILASYFIERMDL